MLYNLCMEEDLFEAESISSLAVEKSGRSLGGKILLLMIDAILIFFFISYLLFLFDIGASRQFIIGYLGKVEKIPLLNEPKKVRLLFTGDLMFDRYIREVAQKKGYDYILESVKPFLLEKDLVISDLEGPITTNKSVSIYSEIGSPPNYIFTFDPVVVEAMKNGNIMLVSIGNNHILNQGWEGLSQTEKYLTEGKIGFFGNVGKKDYKYKTALVKIDGIKIGFVNYNQFVDKALELVLADIEGLKGKVDVLILFAHWGPEYMRTAPVYIQERAHIFIDKGVGLIVGTHPHVIQQVEDYKGKRIYYSLGNFVTDQYWSEETQKGMLVEVDIFSHKDGYKMEFREKYVQMDMSGQTKF